MNLKRCTIVLTKEKVTNIHDAFKLKVATVPRHSSVMVIVLEVREVVMTNIPSSWLKCLKFTIYKLQVIM